MTWIDTEKQKPEPWKDVLIYHFLGDTVRTEVPQAYDVAWWTGKEWLFPWSRDNAPQLVTHWMPLPPSPYGDVQDADKA